MKMGSYVAGFRAMRLMTPTGSHLHLIEMIFSGGCGLCGDL